MSRATGRKMSAEREAARPAEKPYRSLCLCLTCRDRTLLYQRIDTRTEVLVQDAFEELMKGRTSFIVAHRLSTIKNADQILVMKAGNRYRGSPAFVTQGAPLRHKTPP